MPTLKEIRAEYPMYSDMSDGDFAKAFHQKFYSDMPFRDFSKKIRYLPGAQPEEFDHTSPEWQAKQGPTAGMSGFEKFRAGWGKGVIDLARGVGQTVGLVSREDVAESRKRDEPLMHGAGRAGNVTGSIATLIPSAFIPGANTYAGSAAIGAGLGLLQPSTSTKETLTNTALGGVLSPAGLLAGRGVVSLGRGAKSLVEPFTKGGQDRIAARAFQAAAGGTDEAAKAAQAIRGATDILPGAQPTAAELANNAGLAQMERTLRNNPEFTQAFGLRDAGNRNAVVDAVEGLAGDSGRRAAAEAVRESAAGEMYKQATRATYQLDDQLAGLLNRPVVQQALKRAETLAANEGRPFQFMTQSSNSMAGAGIPAQTSSRITGQGLQDLKMAMDEMLSDPTSGFTGKAGNAVKSLRGQIVDWMEKANPAFKAARESYAATSRPLNQMDIGKALRDKLVPALADYGQGTRLRPQAFAQALREGDATAAQAMGRPYGTMAEILDPQQQKMLEQVAKQLARRANAQDLGRSVGSNTAQNLAGQNTMRQMLGPLGLPQSWTERAVSGPLMQGLLGSPARIAGKAMGTVGDENVLRRLVEIGLDPVLAAKILESAANESAGLLRYQSGLVPIASGINASGQ